MNDYTYIQLLLVSFIGLAIHTVAKLQSLQTKARAGNFPFSVVEYLKTDWLSFSISILTIILALVLFDEFINWKEEFLGWKKSIFSLIGYVSNDLAQRVFGVYNKRINDLIDKKTNIADGIE